MKTFLLIFFLSLSLMSASKPNVLFIAIDDLNDWVGVLGGHHQAKTPNIDKLAGEGMLFTKAYCAAPACIPSRSATLTGRHPHSTGCYTNKDLAFCNKVVFKKNKTLPEHFKDNGYGSFGAGKIFHGNYKPAWNNFQNMSHPKNELFNKCPVKIQEVDWAELKVSDEKTGDYKTVKYCIDQLQQKHQKPFFLACGIYRPHCPWYVPEKYFNLYPKNEVKSANINYDDLNDIPKNKPGGIFRILEKNKLHKDAARAYLASISYADAMLGNLMKALKESEYLKNTIVIMWSDHGWHLGEKLHYRKFTLWEESTRIPLIIKMPEEMGGEFLKGVSCKRLVSLVDLYPTLIELCSLPLPSQKLDGKSLVPLLKSPTMEWSRTVLTCSGDVSFSVRSEQWRLISYKKGKKELYNHKTDPNEWTNLAEKAEYSEIIKDLSSYIPTNVKPLNK